MIELAAIALDLHLSAAYPANIGNAPLSIGAKPVLIAHEVRTSQDIGGTIHIEPNDRPRTGRKARIWIALTRRGGEVLPPSSCNCRLEVRSLTNREIRFSVSNSISIIERYLGFPSMEVTFPEAGRYELRLIGSAKKTGDFQSFGLTFTTNVSR